MYMCVRRFGDTIICFRMYVQMFCKFSLNLTFILVNSVPSRKEGGKRGEGGALIKIVQKIRNTESDLDFDFLYKELRTECTFYS